MSNFDIISIIIFCLVIVGFFIYAVIDNFSNKTLENISSDREQYEAELKEIIEKESNIRITEPKYEEVPVKILFRVKDYHQYCGKDESSYRLTLENPCEGKLIYFTRGYYFTKDNSLVSYPNYIHGKYFDLDVSCNDYYKAIDDNQIELMCNEDKLIEGSYIEQIVTEKVLNKPIK